MQFDGQLIAAAIESREAWDIMAAHLDAKEFSPISQFWYEQIARWYTADSSAKSIDKNLLVEAGKLRIKSGKLRDSLVDFMQNLPAVPSADNVVQIALEFKRFTVGMDLGAAIGARDQRRIAELLPKLQELQHATSLQEITERKGIVVIREAVPVEDLFKKVGKENRIGIAPGVLNERAGGGALPGHHIVIFGRPEEGKSTIAINMTNSFVKRQIKTLYIGNEDQIDVLKARVLCRLTDTPLEEIEADKEKYFKMFRERGGEDYLNMVQIDRHATMDNVERLVEKYEPQVLLIDQIRNVSTGTTVDMDMTRKLELLGIRMRSILIEYQLIGVSITQANPAHNRLWLGMEDIDSSKTGLPAQADLLVGVASNDEFKVTNRRALSIPKNKLSSAPNAHEGVIVIINKSTSKVY